MLELWLVRISDGSYFHMTSVEPPIYIMNSLAVLCLGLCHLLSGISILQLERQNDSNKTKKQEIKKKNREQEKTFVATVCFEYACICLFFIFNNYRYDGDNS